MRAFERNCIPTPWAKGANAFYDGRITPEAGPQSTAGGGENEPSPHDEGEVPRPASRRDSMDYNAHPREWFGDWNDVESYASHLRSMDDNEFRHHARQSGLDVQLRSSASRSTETPPSDEDAEAPPSDEGDLPDPPSGEEAETPPSGEEKLPDPEKVVEEVESAREPRPSVAVGRQAADSNDNLYNPAWEKSMKDATNYILGKAEDLQHIYRTILLSGNAKDELVENLADGEVLKEKLAEFNQEKKKSLAEAMEKTLDALGVAKGAEQKKVLAELLVYAQKNCLVMV